MTLPPLRQLMQDMALSLVFFTRLPLPQFDFGARTLAQAIWAAPLAGLTVALISGVVFSVAGMAGMSANVAAALALAAAMLATGCLHEDGLSDVADGFGGSKTAERKLEIMRDSRIGAYGVIALVLVLLAKVGTLADLDDIGVVMSGLICAAAASRAAMPAMIRWLPAARDDGLAAEAGRPAAAHVWTGIAIAVILSVILLTWSGLVALLFAAAAAFAVGL